MRKLGKRARSGSVRLGGLGYMASLSPILEVKKRPSILAIAPFRFRSIFVQNYARFLIS
jgi:hypothetical protein